MLQLIYNILHCDSHVKNKNSILNSFKCEINVLMSNNGIQQGSHIKSFHVDTWV